MKSLLSHFYNEEYLLPWWLEHHKKHFDFGLLINYGSTDRSVEIIKEICPNWQVFDSVHQYFDARNCDTEISFYESQMPGWKIALTVTEFIVGDIDKLSINTPSRMQWYIPGIRFTGWDLHKEFDRSKPLWEQHTNGISYKVDPMAHQCRSYHNFNDLKYPPGRHFLPFNTEDALIFHYAHAIIGPEMLERRLSLQHKISPADKVEGLGVHHYADKDGLDVNKLYAMHMGWLSVGETDCSDLIERVIKK